MTARPRPSVLSVHVDTARRLGVLKGGHAARDLAREFGLKPLWSSYARGYVIDARHVADLIAYAEHRHWVTHYREVGGAA